MVTMFYIRFFRKIKMEWKEWIGKIVFIKLIDNTIYSYSKILAIEEPFISIKDKYGLPVVINISEIQRIKEEDTNVKTM